MNERLLQCLDLGCLEYNQALVVQQDHHFKVVRGELSGSLLMVEHPKIVTLGKSADPTHIRPSLDGVAVVRTDRGGEVTAHMPGQLVVYPVIPVQLWRLSPKRFVELLEDTVIGLLSAYGIVGQRDPINPGIWVEGKKICAIGIRIKSRVTMHGLALNVFNDLSLFDHIVPCGIEGRGVTRMADCSVVQLNLAKVKADLLASFRSSFQADLI